jgi:hypothetical protein
MGASDDAVAAYTAAKAAAAEAALRAIVLVSPLLSPALLSAPFLAARMFALLRATAGSHAEALLALPPAAAGAVLAAPGWGAAAASAPGSATAAADAAATAEALLRTHLTHVATLHELARGARIKGAVATAVAARVEHFCAETGAAAGDPAAWAAAQPLHARARPLLAELLHLALFARGLPRGAEAALSDALYVGIAAVVGEDSLAHAAAAAAQGVEPPLVLTGFSECVSEAAAVWAAGASSDASLAMAGGAVEAIQAAIEQLLNGSGVDFRVTAPMRPNQLKMKAALKTLITRVRSVVQTK